MSTNLFAGVPPYCPYCQSELESDEFDFLGLPEESGGIAGFQCHRCGRYFEMLPPSVLPKEANTMPLGYDITVKWYELTPPLLRWLREQFVNFRDLAPAALLERLRTAPRMVVQRVSGEERDRIVISARRSNVEIEVRPVPAPLQDN